MNDLGTVQVQTKNRTWVVSEELELLEGLKSCVVAGYRTQNGFKPGHLMFLQKHMQDAIPGTDLIARPHIESKLKVWRRDHGCIMTLLDRSGVGWDDENKIISCSQEIWDQHAQNYKGFKGKKNQSWPYYDDWCEVFGKDRATGKCTKDFQIAGAAAKILGDALLKGKGKADECEEVGGNEEEYVVGSNTQEEYSSCNSNKKAKLNPKQNSIDLDASFSGAIHKVIDFANTNISGVNKGAATEESEMRKNLSESLKMCHNLTLHQRLKVAIKLSKDVPLMELFYSLAKEEREAFAFISLEGTDAYPMHFNY